MDDNVRDDDKIDISDGSTDNSVVTDATVGETAAEAAQVSDTVGGEAATGETASADAETVMQAENTQGESTGYIESNAGLNPQYNTQAGSEPAKPAVYYTESYKKTKTRKIGLFHLILVAVLSSIFGAGVMFGAIQLLLPVLQPAAVSLVGNSSQTTASSSNGSYQKIEITKSDSPVTAIAQKVSPSIVGVKITVKSQGGSGFFFDTPSQDATGEGSGIIISQDGYILTNNHVVEGALDGNSNTLTAGSTIQVVLPSNKDKPYTATVVGRDVDSDIAVIKISATGLPAAELGDSDKLQPGELAVAIGSPYGLDYMSSITSGIISGLNRQIQMDNGTTLSLIQTDAAINPGNSGGALCNSQGQVIGINTVKIAATGYEGLGFAIPINHAKEISQSLIQNKYVPNKALLGVSIDSNYTADYAKQTNHPAGALVYEVTPMSSAYRAGIQTGDLITKMDGVAITSYADLKGQINKHKPGDKVKIEIYRYDGQTAKTLTVEATLDEDKNQ